MDEDEDTKVRSKPAVIHKVRNNTTRVARTTRRQVEVTPEPTVVDDNPYWTRYWGGNISYQCKFCPWDSIGSPTDSVDTSLERMLEHQTAAHNNVAGVVTFAANGLPIS